jgi:hypothetical protein
MTRKRPRKKATPFRGTAVATPKAPRPVQAATVTARQPGGRPDLQAKETFMTAAPCHRSADADRDGTGRLRELRRELDRWGIVTGDLAAGTPASVGHLPGTRCEIDSRAPGTLTLTHQPRERDLHPYEAIWLTLALLDANGPWTPVAALVPDPKLPPAGAVSRVLAGRGMTVEPAQDGHGDGEATMALLICNPADQSRGRLTISGGRELTWECRLAGSDSPGPSLSPSGIARAIAAALAGAAGEPR